MILIVLFGTQYSALNDIIEIEVVIKIRTIKYLFE